ncbi:uncharacterized protein LY79DRAFT_94837 [Colletotrichum navitas]|uniref:Uncharacterized protein n=1 Tax=Colletotrichum navitas TaxID=681940 RepID=A0AAD8Q775_9PEZI|nr:uncharacterized protein LY79DRAFT_94837 [Colletotrichum navitas]KAK1595859.1 hypothetical protein LY79DRAFT_94837 [Colletotrichum navitas]
MQTMVLMRAWGCTAIGKFPLGLAGLSPCAFSLLSKSKRKKLERVRPFNKAHVVQFISNKAPLIQILATPFGRGQHNPGRCGYAEGVQAETSRVFLSRGCHQVTFTQGRPRLR